MNPFITLEDLSENASEILPLYCSSASNPPQEYYEGSQWLVVDEMTAKFINAVCSIEVPENKTIVCYDLGDLHVASKAYWALRAAGFPSVKVMPRSAYSASTIPLVQGQPPLVPRAERSYLPFNNEIVMTKEEFLKRETFYQQAVQINYLAFNIIDSTGKLLCAEAVTNFLQSSGIKFSQTRACIVHGKRACLGGVMLAYVSKRSISIVIDEIESLGTPIIRDSRTRECKASKSGEESEEVRYNTALEGYSVTIDEGTKRSAKKTVNTRDGNTCSKCIVF